MEAVAITSVYLLKSQPMTSLLCAGIAMAFFWVFTSQILQVPSKPQVAMMSGLFSGDYLRGWKVAR